MKRIGIFTNRDKDKDLKYTKLLAESITMQGGEVIIPSDLAKDIGIKSKYEDEKEFLNNSEIIISLGGDGTFLKAARKVYGMGIPIMGINLGNLGFLTEVETGDVHSAVSSILEDKFELENRMMLEARIVSDGRTIARDVAVNDVVISRGCLPKITRLKMYIDDVLTETFPGDGLIVSTPTGSTAYTLAAGGPIVEPNTDLIIATPICPHILYSRSYITSSDKVYRIAVDEDYHHNATVTVDGQTGYEIKAGDYVEIRKSQHYVKLARLKKRNFFNVVRYKIYTRGESIRNNEV